jgi:hypothetical protein
MKLMDRIGWIVILAACLYLGYHIGYALAYSPALREVIK